jgi:hypothetical protein
VPGDSRLGNLEPLDASQKRADPLLWSWVSHTQPLIPTDGHARRVVYCTQRCGQLIGAAVVGREEISSELGTPAGPRVGQRADHHSKCGGCLSRLGSSGDSELTQRR